VINDDDDTATYSYMVATATRCSSIELLPVKAGNNNYIFSYILLNTERLRFKNTTTLSCSSRCLCPGAWTYIRSTYYRAMTCMHEHIRVHPKQLTYTSLFQQARPLQRVLECRHHEDRSIDHGACMRFSAYTCIYSCIQCYCIYINLYKIMHIYLAIFSRK
jgi:hypothetical protein